MNLECSSRGDKRFSAFYARITVGGKNDSIENHYQLSKRFGEMAPQTWRDAKGKKPTHFVVNGKRFEMTHFSCWYKLLWVKYLDQHPELVEYAKQFDTFTDMFRGKALNCQADVIRDYIKKGRHHIINECRSFIDKMKEVT